MISAPAQSPQVVVRESVAAPLTGGSEAVMARDVATPANSPHSVGRHVPVSASAKKGSHVQRMFDKASGKQFATRLTRAEDGAPYSSIEVAAGNQVISVTEFTWERSGNEFILAEQHTDRYSNGVLLARIGSSLGGPLAVLSGQWQNTSPSATLAAGSNLLVTKATPRTTAFGVDCNDPDSWMEEACWGYDGGDGGGGGGEQRCVLKFAAMVLAGAAATVALAAIPAGALATFVTGGVLGPVELGIIAAWLAAEAVFANQTADWQTCMAGG